MSVGVGARRKLQKVRTFLIIFQNVVIYQITKLFDVDALRRVGEIEPSCTNTGGVSKKAVIFEINVLWYPDNRTPDIELKLNIQSLKSGY